MHDERTSELTLHTGRPSRELTIFFCLYGNLHSQCFHRSKVQQRIAVVRYRQTYVIGRQTYVIHRYEVSRITLRINQITHYPIEKKVIISCKYWRKDISDKNAQVSLQKTKQNKTKYPSTLHPTPDYKISFILLNFTACMNKYVLIKIKNYVKM